MAKVYVVTTGSYDQYGIDAIFSTKTVAQRYADALDLRESAAVEEFEIDDPALLERQLGKE